MTDRELLELAAKAIDKALGIYFDDEIGFEAPFYGEWNPLKDDSDALHLAVATKQNIDASFGVIRVSVRLKGALVFSDIRRDENTDSNIRKAIVRNAARVGEAME